jgi:co-chaperonin GroES (HSP10)
MTFRPPHNKVAITPIFDRDVTESGRLYIPDIAKERCDQGVVKYIGDGVKEVKVGDYVIFSGYDGTLLNIEGEGRLIIMPESHIQGVLPEVENIYVPGLYFKTADGYEVANYEQAMEFISAAFTSQGRLIEVKGGQNTSESAREWKEDAERKRTG